MHIFLNSKPCKEPQADINYVYTAMHGVAELWGVK